MINNVNQMLMALMSKNAKKAGSVDADSDAFQALLAALMSQGMNMQGNNATDMAGLQGQLSDMLGASGQAVNTDVFGINPAVMRMLSGLKGGSESVQADDSNLQGFEQVIQGFLEEAGQEALAKSGVVDSAASTQVSQTQGKAVDAKVVDSSSNVEVKKVVDTEQENNTISRGIANSMTTAHDSLVKDSAGKHKGFDTVKDAVEVTNINPMDSKKATIPQEGEQVKANTIEDAVKSSDINSKDSKAVNTSKDGTQLLAKTVEKSTESQFIVTRPEILKILKGENTRESSKSQSPGIQSASGTKTENQDGVQNIALKTELSSEQDPGKKKDEMPKHTQDATIQTTHTGSVHQTRQQDTTFEVKQPAAVSREDILNQVLDKVKFINGKDTSELNISLRPESLGEVSIKLVMDKGIMTAKIMVENSQVKSMIDSSLPQIKESLRNQNIDVTNLNVSVNLGQGELPQNRDFNFSRWTYNKKGVPRNGSSNDDIQVDTVRPREVYTQKTGLNLYA